MTHRGGVAADGLSGDGCGLLLKQPDKFLRTLGARSGDRTGRASSPQGWCSCHMTKRRPSLARETLRAAMADVQLAIAGWRTPPLDAEACGTSARKTMPRIEQVFVTPLLDVEGARPTPDAFRLALYLARRRASQQLRDAMADFYVVSLSPALHRLQGHGAAGAAAARSSRTCSAPSSTRSAVVFHQRFSTNTLSALAAGAPVPHARPQRRDQHHRRQPRAGRRRARNVCAVAAPRHRASSTR